MITEKRQKELVMINRVLATLVVFLAFYCGILLTNQKTEPKPVVREEYPVPVMDGVLMLKAPDSPLALLLKQARYQREVDSDQQLTKDELLRIIWAGQGEITEWGERTAPSYKSQFPAELRVMVKGVEGIPIGWYKYESVTQQLLPIKDLVAPTDILNAPAIISLWSINPNPAYPEMMWHESGEIAQNILLMTQELKLASVFNIGDQNQELWKISVGKGKI